MTDTGLDWAWVSPNLDEVWAAGYRFVSRYLSYDTTGKNLTVPELAALRAHGFEVAANWEWYGDWAHDYSGGAANGTQHATDAVKQAQGLGYPQGCTIYFSVDFQETNGQIAAVDDYTRAAAVVVHAAGYRMGAYGGIGSISQLFDAGLIDDGWQTYAWSNGQWDPRAAIQQDQNDITVGGVLVDHNTRVGQTHLMGQSTVEDKMITVIPGPTADTYYKSDGMHVQKITGKDLADLRYLASLGAVQLWHDPTTGSDIWNGGLVPAFGVDVATLTGSTAPAAPADLVVTLTGTAKPAA